MHDKQPERSSSPASGQSAPEHCLLFHSAKHWTPDTGKHSYSAEQEWNQTEDGKKISSKVLLEKLQKKLPECDCVRFSDGYWYKFTKKTATKEDAILHMCEFCNISTDDIIAFGDDYADIGMIKLCGVGIAMGNAIEEVKNIADCVIGDNDHDGIAIYLRKIILERV